jgi:cytochrome c2
MSAVVVRLLDWAKAVPLTTLFLAVVASGGLVLLGMILPAGEIKDRVLARFDGLRQLGDVADVQELEWTRMGSGLHDIETLRIPIGTFGGGGGIEEIGDSILFSTPVGFIGYLTSDNELRYTELRVPMRFEELVGSRVFNMPNFTRNWFRTLDLLALAQDDGSHDLYVSHHRYMGDCIAVVLSKIKLESRGGLITGAQDGWEEVYSARPCVPFYPEGIEVFSGQVGGGRVVRLNENELLMTTGDHSFDGVHTPGDAYAQDLDNDLGKVLKIDLRSGAVDVFASGIRNPQGLLITSDGIIWQTDHGPRGGDELNIVEAGVDYGWPSVTLGKTYQGTPWPSNPHPGRHWNYREPVFAFVPSVGTSNLVEMRGAEFPLWDGDLLVTTLVDRTLYRLRRNGNTIQYSEPIRTGERMRDILVQRDGRIVALSDDGYLLLIRNAETAHPRNAVQVSGLAVLPRMEAETFEGWADPDTPVGRGHVVFARACQSCHPVIRGTGVGPHLGALIGREVGAVDGFAYSAALTDSDERWSHRLLRSYLDDPQATFPGTVMVDPGVTRSETDDIIAYLESFDAVPEQ